MGVASVKAALLTVLADAFAGDPNVLVSHGTPDPSAMPDVVAVLDTTAEGDGDEQAYRHTLVISCYVGGGNAAASVALARAHDLFAVAYDTIHANPTLGGGCRVAAVDPDFRSVETMAYDPAGSTTVGRLCEITATVRTWTGLGLLGSLASAHNVP